MKQVMIFSNNRYYHTNRLIHSALQALHGFPSWSVDSLPVQLAPNPTRQSPVSKEGFLLEGSRFRSKIVTIVLSWRVGADQSLAVRFCILPILLLIRARCYFSPNPDFSSYIPITMCPLHLTIQKGYVQRQSQCRTLITRYQPNLLISALGQVYQVVNIELEL